MALGGRLVHTKGVMIPRLIVLLTILSTFAIAFAEIVKRSENSVDTVSPCKEWSNPDCLPLPPQPQKNRPQ
jgi:hypothetical protein